MERKLLKFYADWCGPCRPMTQVVNDLAAEHSIEVEAINIDTDRETTAQYGVASIPTVVYLEDGQEVARNTGAVPMSKLASSLGLS